MQENKPKNVISDPLWAADFFRIKICVYQNFVVPLQQIYGKALSIYSNLFALVVVGRC